jgi:succinoglycan biosynthesis protein ExoL
MRVAYFVHDVNDPAVHRRVRMLRSGGAEVTLLGFSRDRGRTADGLAPIILGYTANARMVQRSMAVAKAAATMRRWQDVVAEADVIIARQLETLVLAVLARRRVGNAAPLVYECLDIHHLMVSPKLPSRLLRRLEGVLLRACDSLIVSSERFVTEYFAPTHGTLPRIEFVENKVLSCELADLAALPAQRALGRPDAPPWRIGWYGIIRCRRSLGVLANLVKSLPGTVEVTIRGRVARDGLPDFDEVVASTPGMTYGGPYDRRRDLPDLYASQHFFWAIDFSDRDSSNWLLPNRLYEGGLFGTVPITMRSMETGRWLAARHAGVLLEDDLEASLNATFAAFDAASYAASARAMAAIPVESFLFDETESKSLATRLLFGNVRRVAATQKIGREAVEI